MDWAEVKAFLDEHPDVEAEQPGLYLFLTDIRWRTDYEVDIDEAEHLARIKFLDSINSNPLTWARELLRYRAQFLNPSIS